MWFIDVLVAVIVILWQCGWLMLFCQVGMQHQHVVLPVSWAHQLDVSRCNAAAATSRRGHEMPRRHAGRPPCGQPRHQDGTRLLAQPWHHGKPRQQGENTAWGENQHLHEGGNLHQPDVNLHRPDVSLCNLPICIATILLSVCMVDIWLIFFRTSGGWNLWDTFWVCFVLFSAGQLRALRREPTPTRRDPSVSREATPRNDSTPSRHQELRYRCRREVVLAHVAVP